MANTFAAKWEGTDFITGEPFAKGDQIFIENGRVRLGSKEAKNPVATMAPKVVRHEPRIDENLKDQGFVQRAAGHLSLQVVPGSNHCAITEPTIEIDYNIAVGFDVSALDRQGFLFDSLAFKAYFEDLASKPIDFSCEYLTYKICQDFKAMLDQRLPYCRWIEVFVSPFKGVRVEYKEICK